jgi:hypothetical protein
MVGLSLQYLPRLRIVMTGEKMTATFPLASRRSRVCALPLPKPAEEGDSDSDSRRCAGEGVNNNNALIYSSKVLILHLAARQTKDNLTGGFLSMGGKRLSSVSQ